MLKIVYSLRTFDRFRRLDYLRAVILVQFIVKICPEGQNW